MDDSGRFTYADGSNMTYEYFQNGYSKATYRKNYDFYVHSAYAKMYVIGNTNVGAAICKTDAVSKYS